MRKVIELLRHTDNRGDLLTADGVAAAVDLGGRLTGGYDIAVSTGAQRATQTIACLLAGLGEEVPGGVIVEFGLRSAREDVWRDAYQQASGGGLADFRRVAPEFVEVEAQTLGAGLARIADRLEDGGRALVVGHSPTNEAAVLGFSGKEIDPLGKGEGVRVVIEDARIEVEPLESHG